MPPRHFSPYYRFTTLPPKFKFILPFLTLITLFLFKSYRFIVCQYTTKTTPHIGFVNRLSTNSFSYWFRWIVFSQSENEEYAGFLYFPPIFLIKYCVETFVSTCAYQSHHCRTDYLLCNKASFELLPKGNYPFSVDLRPATVALSWLLFEKYWQT